MMQRPLVMVLGDQLVWPHPLIDDGCVVVMAEVLGEVTRYPNHVQRVALFLSAMRHYRARLEEHEVDVDYRELCSDGPRSLADALRQAIVTHKPSCVRLIEPGRWDLKLELEAVCSDQATALEWVEHPGFFLKRADFDEWATGRKRFLLE
ncbi:MAG: deoxyribodipyrimidine photolyase-related protein, partial [Flavobacteriales bacterium]